MAEKQWSYHVALSFAGEDRAYVEKTADVLREMGLKVFYDKYETVTLWGKDLYTHLHEVYASLSLYTVMFLSSAYKDKLWANHERRSAQSRAFEENREYILPARFDDTKIPGILPTIGYINLNDYTPQQFAELIKQKIGPLKRENFFPRHLDRLYSELGVTNKKGRAKVDAFAYNIFETLQLMTVQEKHLIATAWEHACPAGLTDNIHMNLELLSRFAEIPVEEVLAKFARMDCLSIKSRVYENHEHDDDGDSLVKSRRILEFKYELMLPDYEEDNATYILVAVLKIMADHLCPECLKKALERTDLSVLGTITSFDEC